MAHGASEIRDHLKRKITPLKTKTAAQMNKESIEAAKKLPTETKKKFWTAMTKGKKNLGEARKIAGIDDLMIAAQLVLLCHDTVHVPKPVDDIE